LIDPTSGISDELKEVKKRMMLAAVYIYTVNLCERSEVKERNGTERNGKEGAK
jgi:hypothetical protein